MSEAQLARGKVAFQTEGRLLQELGERLVASPEVALVELIKNAYDADLSACEVHLIDDDKTLVVQDYGIGMTLDQFKNRWMRIATSQKRSVKGFRQITVGGLLVKKVLVVLLSVFWATICTSKP